MLGKMRLAAFLTVANRAPHKTSQLASIFAITCALAVHLTPATALAVVPAISAGLDRTCAVSSSGAALCWGDNAAGALGNGTVNASLMPTTVVGLAGGGSVLGRGSAAYHQCAVTTSGGLFCWGNNEAGQLGDGTTLNSVIPIQVAGINGAAVSVAMGTSFTCALTSAGAVFCWGAYPGGFSSTPVAIDGLSVGVRSIASGEAHMCALMTTGAVMCWGDNASGQLGTGDFTYRPNPVAVAGLPTVSAIALGRSHSCALSTGGAVACWGNSGAGMTTAVPTIQGLGSGVTQLSAGAYFTCALTAAANVLCWGDNNKGQLGDGSTTASQQPVHVSNLANATYISAGYAFVCAITTGGGASCWGENASGNLGNGNETDSSVPLAVVGLAGSIVSIQGGLAHTCALAASGLVQCWGNDNFGQLGNGAAALVSAWPVTVAGLSSGTMAVSVGDFFACAITAAGGVACWGEDTEIELGNPVFRDSSRPVQTTLSSGVTSIASGATHTCAVTNAGAVFCWGNQGGIGNGSTESVLPAQVPGLSAIAVAAGGNHSCAISAAGSVLCWGDNTFGQLGDGTTNDALAPVVVNGITTRIVSIATGSTHSCALTTAGNVLCWGANFVGQLGTGTTDDSRVPVLVKDLSGVVAISARGYHNCALTLAGSVSCWGFNGNGQLGTGTTVSSSIPVGVSGLSSGIGAVAAGDNHSCAIATDGTVYCWGLNAKGGDGDGTFATRLTPVVVVNLGASGSIATKDWFLDLKPSVSKTIPPPKVPAMLAKAAGTAATAVVDVQTTLQFRSQDLGKQIYVFGYVPASLAKEQPAEKEGPDCLLAQLNSAGQLQAVTGSTLGAYVNNVQSTQGQAIHVVNSVPARNVAGSTFCVGTSGSSTQALAGSNSRCVVTVPPLAPTDTTCVPPDIPDPLSGLWWNSNESGWGIHMTQRRDIVFAAWYTYGASSSPKWFVSTCAMSAGATGTTGTCNGAIYEVSGPTFFGTPFNPQLANAVQNGNLQVNFQNADNASMTYSGVSGQTRTVPITRQPLAPGAVSGVNYTDIWWGGASESGWGIAITQQASVVFLAWYVYDAAGKPVWYVATCTLNGTACAGDLLHTTGPPFGPTFNSSQVQSSTVGAVSVNFTDGNNATLTYTVNGVSASKTITRQLF